VPLTQEVETELYRLLTAEVEQSEDDISQVREKLRELVQEMQQWEAQLLSAAYLEKSVQSFMVFLGNDVNKFPFSILGDEVHGCHYQVSAS
jgi:hypothetical protein